MCFAEPNTDSNIGKQKKNQDSATQYFSLNAKKIVGSTLLKDLW